MDILRNLLFIMSNMIYVTQNKRIMCLPMCKYPDSCRPGGKYIINGFNYLAVNSL
jgi:hypothetical protein